MIIHSVHYPDRMLGGTVDDIIDLEKSLDDSELLFSSKVSKEKIALDDNEVVAPLLVESLFEENAPEGILTAVPLSPPFRKISNIKFYRPPTPAKPLNKRFKLETDSDEEAEVKEEGKECFSRTTRPYLEHIAGLARINPTLTFIPRLKKNVLK